MNKGWGDYLDSFRFEDENEYEYETLVLKKRNPGKLTFIFFTEKVSKVIYSEGG